MGFAVIVCVMVSWVEVLGVVLPILPSASLTGEGSPLSSPIWIRLPVALFPVMVLPEAVLAVVGVSAVSFPVVVLPVM